MQWKQPVNDEWRCGKKTWLNLEQFLVKLNGDLRRLYLWEHRLRHGQRRFLFYPFDSKRIFLDQENVHPEWWRTDVAKQLDYHIDFEEMDHSCNMDGKKVCKISVSSEGDAKQKKSSTTFYASLPCREKQYNGSAKEDITATGSGSLIQIPKTPCNIICGILHINSWWMSQYTMDIWWITQYTTIALERFTYGDADDDDDDDSSPVPGGFTNVFKKATSIWDTIIFSIHFFRGIVVTTIILALIILRILQHFKKFWHNQKRNYTDSMLLFRARKTKKKTRIVKRKKNEDYVPLQDIV